MVMAIAAVFILLSLTLLSIKEISGHGRMLEPPNRSSLWRYNSNAPINYDDNQNFCGGFNAQWSMFEGRCGVCGDRYDEPHPQANENGGKYGRGIIAGEYLSGSEIDVLVQLTANHKGFFEYSLCVLDDALAPESGEECFQLLTLSDGSTRHLVDQNERLIQNQVQLPYNVTCDRCVLRWHYTTGNNWGYCADGTGRLGCGPQETFRSCADVQIV